MIAWVASAWAGCLVVQGGALWDGADAVPGALVTVDGRIAAVGAVDGLGSGPARWGGQDCERIELPAGAVLTPGLVQVGSAVGLAEVGGERATVDTRGSGDPVRASLVVAEAYNPRSVHVPVLRLGGITAAVVLPAEGRVSGQAGYVRLAGTRWDEAVVDRSVAMVANLAGASRAESLAELRALIEDARAFGANAAAVDGNRFRAFADGASRQDLQALLAVARREIPLLIDADRAADLEAALRLADQLGIALILRGAAEGWLVAEALAAAQVPVIVDPLVQGPGSFEAVRARADNPARLAAAGVQVILAPGSTHNAAVLAQVAGNAVRSGMHRADALNAITLHPARAFGQPDRGALEVGAVADLVAWSGDPLELSTDVLWVMIDGVRQPMVSRQTQLRDRYRAMPGSPLPALPLDR